MKKSSMLTKDEMLKLRSSGKSNAEIATIASVSKQRIQSMIGKVDRTHSHWLEQKIINLFDSSKPTEEISREYNLSYHKIYRIWKKVGLLAQNRKPVKVITTTTATPIQEIYGFWIVLKRVWINKNTKEYFDNSNSVDPLVLEKQTYYECKCLLCGTVKAIWKNNLVRGTTKSCRQCSYKLRKENNK